MQTRSKWYGVALALFIMLPTLLLLNMTAGPESVARGKAAALPLTDTMSPEQALAQELALADSRVQELTNGSRTEVFGVQEVGQHFTKAASACANADCRQVNIYNFDQNSAVTALVNVDSQEVLDVLDQPGTRPGINKRLADLALDIAFNAPEVSDVLGYKPEKSDWAPMDSGLLGTICDAGHMCVAPTFDMGDYILWAIVDLTDEKFVDLAWTSLPAEEGERGVAYPYEPQGCPTPGVVEQDGWVVNYETTGTDGFRVYDVTYNGAAVLTSAKNAEWHADYGSSGFIDSTGCSSGGGFPIYPYGDTEMLELQDEDGNVVGFSLVQDFRMGSWGSGCNYRYDQHYQFFNDGRFRTVVGAYGKGCGDNSLYRALMRIDIAVDGDENDSFSSWSAERAGSVDSWAVEETELRLGPGAGELSPEGYAWRVMDGVTGNGYMIAPGRGQFNDGGTGDNEFIYAVQHHANEGDTDLGAVGTCCNDDEHGPEQYMNDESIMGQNIVLWYVPQQQTIVNPDNYYCWTVTGEPNPETYPCYAGPMFTPFSSEPVEPAVASFSHNAPVALGEAVEFSNTSTGGGSMSYAWDFGDGNTSNEMSPSHMYEMAGIFDVTLTVTNEAGSDTAEASAEVEAPTAVTISELQTNRHETSVLLLWGMGSLIAMGIALTRIISVRRQM